MGLGWGLIRVNADKTPFERFKTEDGEYQGETDSSLLVDALAHPGGSGIALLTGAPSGVIVIDIDVDGAKPGRESQVLLECKAGVKLDELGTLSARTGGGGKHYFFKFEPGQKLKNWAPVKGLPGIDVRTTGGFVVIPPSELKKGAYVWDDLRGGSEITLEHIKPLPPEIEAALVESVSGGGAGRSLELSGLVRSKRDSGSEASLPVEEREVLRGALSYLPADDFWVWSNVGLCLAYHDVDGDMWELFDDWSRTAPEKYDVERNFDRWQSFVDGSQGGRTLQWLYNFARKEYLWPDKRYQSAVPKEVARRVSFDESGDALLEELSNALEHVSAAEVGHVLFYAPMGAGKTHQVARAVSKCPSSFVLALPDHKLISEAEQHLQASDVPCTVHQGVGHACHFKQRYKDLGQPSNWKSKACTGCEHKKVCGVFALKRKVDSGEGPGLVLATHAAVPTLPVELRDRVVIFDEMPETIGRWELRRSQVVDLTSLVDLPSNLRSGLEFLDIAMKAVEEAYRDDPEMGESDGLSPDQTFSLLMGALQELGQPQQVFNGLSALASSFGVDQGVRPEDVRSGQAALKDLLGVSALAGLLTPTEFIGDEPRRAVRLTGRDGVLKWILMEAREAPERTVVLDGTAAFSERELAAWIGSGPRVFGVDVEPSPGVEIERILYHGRRFNRSRLSGSDMEKSISFLVEEVTRVARDEQVNLQEPGTIGVIARKPHQLVLIQRLGVGIRSVRPTWTAPGWWPGCPA